MSDIVCPPEKVYSAMGYGHTKPDDFVCDLTKSFINKANQIVNGSFYYVILPCQVLRESYQIKIGETVFDTARTITILLKGSSHIAIFAASVGHEFQEWIDEEKKEGDILRMFVLDSLGSEIVESIGDLMELSINEELKNSKDKHTNRFSPGYCYWNVSQQQKLFSFLPENVCGITLHESSLMTPIKSISGFVGIGEHVKTKKYGCAICNNKNCYLRKKRLQEEEAIKTIKREKYIAH